MSKYLIITSPPKWVVVKIAVPFWVPIILRHLLFRVPQKGTIILTTTQVGFRVLFSRGSGFRGSFIGFLQGWGLEVSGFFVGSEEHILNFIGFCRFRVLVCYTYRRSPQEKMILAAIQASIVDVGV